MKNILFIFLFIISTLSCTKHSYAPLLTLNNKNLNSIIDCINVTDDYIRTIVFYNKSDSIYMDITYNLEIYSEEELPLIITHLYGIYIYKGKQILIYGDSAKSIFKKTGKKIVVEHLNKKNIAPSDYVPITFDPEVITYYLKNDSIIFLRTNYEYKNN